MALIHENLTGQIIKAFYNVYNELGYGFLEKVYENALALELESMGLRVGRQRPIRVHYLGRQVGDYYADLIVEGLVIFELKCAEALCEAHEAQLLNYLKATDVEVGLLLNFGRKPAFRRKIFTNDKKRHQSYQQRRMKNPCESVKSASSVVHTPPGGDVVNFPTEFKKQKVLHLRPLCYERSSIYPTPATFIR